MRSLLFGSANTTLLPFSCIIFVVMTHEIYARELVIFFSFMFWKIRFDISSRFFFLLIVVTSFVRFFLGKYGFDLIVLLRILTVDSKHVEDYELDCSSSSEIL